MDTPKDDSHVPIPDLTVDPESVPSTEQCSAAPTPMSQDDTHAPDPSTNNSVGWRTTHPTLLGKLGYILEHNVASDITFKVGRNRTQVPAHSLILTAHSESFALGQLSTELLWIEPGPFRHFLRYLYTEVLEVGIEEAVDILRIADHFGVKSLVRLCEERVKKDLSAVFSGNSFLGFTVNTMGRILGAGERNITQVEAFKTILRWGERQRRIMKGVTGDSNDDLKTGSSDASLQGILEPLLLSIDFNEFNPVEFATIVVPAKVIPEGQALTLLSNLSIGSPLVTQTAAADPERSQHDQIPAPLATIDVEKEIQPVNTKLEDKGSMLIFHMSRSGVVKFAPVGKFPQKYKPASIPAWIAFANGKYVIGNPAHAVEGATCLKDITSGDKKYPLAGRQARYEYIMGLFLAKCRQMAENNVRELFTGCVIVLPAKRTCVDAQAMRDSAVGAGFVKVQLMSEATAIAFDYYESHIAKSQDETATLQLPPPRPVLPPPPLANKDIVPLLSLPSNPVSTQPVRVAAEQKEYIIVLYFPSQGGNELVLYQVNRKTGRFRRLRLPAALSQLAMASDVFLPKLGTSLFNLLNSSPEFGLYSCFKETIDKFTTISKLILAGDCHESVTLAAQDFGIHALTYTREDCSDSAIHGAVSLGEKLVNGESFSLLASEKVGVPISLKEAAVIKDAIYEKDISLPSTISKTYDRPVRDRCWAMEWIIELTHSETKINLGTFRATVPKEAECGTHVQYDMYMDRNGIVSIGAELCSVTKRHDGQKVVEDKKRICAIPLQRADSLNMRAEESKSCRQFIKTTLTPTLLDDILKSIVEDMAEEQTNSGLTIQIKQ